MGLIEIRLLEINQQIAAKIRHQLRITINHQVIKVKYLIQLQHLQVRLRESRPHHLLPLQRNQVHPQQNQHLPLHLKDSHPLQSPPLQHHPALL